MVVEQLVSEEAYLREALSDPDGVWELHGGRLVEKPGMTWAHSGAIALLATQLVNQLDWDDYHVMINDGRLRRAPDRHFVPDIAVVPVRLAAGFADDPAVLPVFPDPLPLVVEAWSFSTAGYDVATKLPQYQERGDGEIWFLHPYERTLTTWVRQPDGSYQQTLYREGIVRPAFLPGVVIDLADVFRR